MVTYETAYFDADSVKEHQDEGVTTPGWYFRTCDCRHGVIESDYVGPFTSLLAAEMAACDDIATMKG